MPINIAVIQFEIQPFSPEENLKKAEHFIQQASSSAQIIVFPEDFFLGHSMVEASLSTMMDNMSGTFSSLQPRTKLT